MTLIQQCRKSNLKISVEFSARNINTENSNEWVTVITVFQVPKKQLAKLAKECVRKSIDAWVISDTEDQATPINLFLVEENLNDYDPIDRQAIEEGLKQP